MQEGLATFTIKGEFGPHCSQKTRIKNENQTQYILLRSVPSGGFDVQFSWWNIHFLLWLNVWRARGRSDCETTPSVSPANRQVIDKLPSSLSFLTKYKVLSSQSSSKETHSAAVWPFLFHRSSLAAWQRHIQSQSNRASLRLIHHGTNTASSSRTVCSYLAYLHLSQ